MTGWVSARAEQTTIAGPLGMARQQDQRVHARLDRVAVRQQPLARQRVERGERAHRERPADQRGQRLRRRLNLIIVAGDVEQRRRQRHSPARRRGTGARAR